MSQATRLERIGFAMLLAAAVLITATTDAAAAQTGAEPAVLHLDRLFDSAEVRGTAGSPAPDAILWTGPGLESWRAGSPWAPDVAPADVVLDEGTIHVRLSEPNRGANGRLTGSIMVELPRGLWPEDWAAVEVTARTTGPVRRFQAGMGLREGTGQPGSFPWPYAVQSQPPHWADPGGGSQVYRLNLRWPREAREHPFAVLGVWFEADGPTEIEISSIRLVPKDEPYPDTSGVVARGPSPAVYTRTPGRITYALRTPADGHLTVDLETLRSDAPVRFRVLAHPENGSSEIVLEESVTADDGTMERTVDVSHLSGRPVELTLEASSDRQGSVAIWRAPKVYTPATLAVRVLEEASDAPTPARVHLTGAAGDPAPLPPEAVGVSYGRNDQQEGFARQPDGAFYVPGEFEVELVPGQYRLEVTKGYEYRDLVSTLELAPGEDGRTDLRMERWIDMPARSWYSGDDHIHLRRSPRENPRILQWLAAEDLHVGALLQVGDVWTTYFPQYAWGKDGVYKFEDRFLTSGQEEPRTHELGHTISLGAEDFVRFWGEYYHYDRVFDRVRELGGVTGYAHQGVTFHGYRGLTLDVLRDKVDFVEILQFCAGDPPLKVEHYYHFLDLGFPLTAMAGSDFPWCGRETGADAQIGNARFYTLVSDSFTFEKWRSSLKAGHTFVSSGPMLELTVDGRVPGDTLRVEPGQSIPVRARAYGHPDQIPLRDLEIVVHGDVVRSVGADEPGQSAETLRLEFDLPVQHGFWIAARTKAGPHQFAHTTPVYVTTGAGFHDPADWSTRLDQSERYLDEIEEELDHPGYTIHEHAWRYGCTEEPGCIGDGLRRRIAETRRVIAELRAAYSGGSDDGVHR